MSESKSAGLPVDEGDWSYPGRRVALASGLGVFVSFASLLVYTFGIFLKPVAQEFAWSRQGVSLAFGIAAMGVAVCSPMIGHLLDRFGARRVILPCLTVFGCAFASIAWMTPSIWHLYAVFAVLGIVGNGTAQLAYSRAASTWYVRRRGMALAVLMAGGAIGAMVLPPAAQALIDHLGWRGAVMTLGGMVLVLGLPVIARFVHEKPAGRPSPYRRWVRRAWWAALSLDGCWTASSRREWPSFSWQARRWECSCSPTHTR